MTRGFLLLACAAAAVLVAGCGNSGSRETEKVQALQIADLQRKIGELEGKTQKMTADVHHALEDREKFQHELDLEKVAVSDRDNTIVALQDQMKAQQAVLDAIGAEMAKASPSLDKIRDLLESVKKAPAKP